MIETWKSRRMSLAGKISIIKSLITSKLIYCISTLPSPSKPFWEEANKLLYKFIYDGKGEKIKRDTLIGSYEDGGYKMIDIITKNKVMKLSWMEKCIRINGIWKEYMCSKVPVDIQYMARCNIKFIDLPFKFPKNSIWTEIWINWCLESYVDTVETQEAILSQNIWFNSHIKINNRCIHYKKWESKGIQWLNDLTYEEDDLSIRFLTYEELCDFYNFHPLQIIYQGLLHAIPREWKKNMMPKARNEEVDDYKLIDKLTDHTEPTKWLYQKMVKKKCIQPSKAISKWLKDLNSTTIWEDIMKENFKQRQSTVNNRLRSFNYNFMLRNIPYEKRLWKMKIKMDSNCQLCHIEEDILHLYWLCPHSKRLWERLKLIIENYLRTSFPLSAEKCLLGTNYKISKSKQEAVNLLCILTKHYLHLSKCNNTPRSTIGLELYIRSTLKLERRIATEKGLINLFNHKWKGLTDWIDLPP